MGLIKIPEYIIHDAIQKLFDYLRKDYLDCATNNQIPDSVLHAIIDGVDFQKYRGMEQAKQIFVDRDDTDPRKIKLDLGFNMQTDGSPTIHITVPSDSQAQNSIGMGEGENGEIWDDTVGTNQSISVPIKDRYFQTYNRRYKATYDLVITSNNSNETVLIYHVLRALIGSIVTHLHEKGLQNISISGNDLALYSEVAPKQFYVRALRVSFEYESGTVNLFKIYFPSNITFQGTILPQ